MPLRGIVDATIGQVLDKRVIPDADDCWIAGRQHRHRAHRPPVGRRCLRGLPLGEDAATAGGYFAGDVSGVGDEAFCTGMSEAASFGVLVRPATRSSTSA